LYLSIIRIKNAFTTKDCTVIQSAEIKSQISSAKDRKDFFFVI